MTKEWDEALRYDYPLTPESIVFDIGGFEGEWASNIYSKYGCNLFIFEPIKDFYTIIKDKFRREIRVEVFNCGLGKKNETIKIGVSGSATSVFSKSTKYEWVMMKDIRPIIISFSKIDLIKINIEGAEYDLLDYIIEKGLQTRLVNIQVQFHMNVPDYEKRRQKIRDELSKTHHLTYDFAYTHENWKLND